MCQSVLSQLSSVIFKTAGHTLYCPTVLIVVHQCGISVLPLLPSFFMSEYIFWISYDLVIVSVIY